MHQPLELVARVIVLAVDQGEAFGEEPHMYNGGLGRARGELDGWCSQPIAQRRRADPTDAVLLQHSGERNLANALTRARRRQVLPEVERPRRRNVVVNRVEELRVVASEIPSFCYMK